MTTSNSSGATPRYAIRRIACIPHLVKAEQLAAAYVDDETLMTAEQLEAMNAVRMNPS
jgi:hypothetical protein